MKLISGVLWLWVAFNDLRPQPTAQCDLVIVNHKYCVVDAATVQVQPEYTQLTFWNRRVVDGKRIWVCEGWRYADEAQLIGNTIVAPGLFATARMASSEYSWEDIWWRNLLDTPGAKRERPWIHGGWNE